VIIGDIQPHTFADVYFSTDDGCAGKFYLQCIFCLRLLR
jgi:hypothetical protein